MSLPHRKKLSHALPLSVRPSGVTFFLTICALPRGNNQLCQPPVSQALLESVAFLHRRGDWWVDCALLMPDHCHLVVTFADAGTMPSVVTNWKRYTARMLPVCWQRDFFDHRLRQEESLRAKIEYVLHNPVRAGLVRQPQDWTWVWWPSPAAA